MFVSALGTLRRVQNRMQRYVFLLIYEYMLQSKE